MGIWTFKSKVLTKIMKFLSFYNMMQVLENSVKTFYKSLMKSWQSHRNKEIITSALTCTIMPSKSFSLTSNCLCIQLLSNFQTILIWCECPAELFITLLIRKRWMLWFKFGRASLTFVIQQQRSKHFELSQVRTIPN